MKNLFRGLLIIGLGILALVVVAAIALNMTISKKSFLVEVTGTEGQAFIAVFDIDGERKEIHSKVPSTFGYDARTLSFEITPDRGANEKVMVKMYVDGEPSSSCDSWGGVRGKFSQTYNSVTTVISGMPGVTTTVTR